VPVCYSVFELVSLGPGHPLMSLRFRRQCVATRQWVGSADAHAWTTGRHRWLQLTCCRMPHGYSCPSLRQRIVTINLVLPFTIHVGETAMFGSILVWPIPGSIAVATPNVGQSRRPSLYGNPCASLSCARLPPAASTDVPAGGLGSGMFYSQGPWATVAGDRR
jgi:hypothetical protein